MVKNFTNFRKRSEPVPQPLAPITSSPTQGGKHDSAPSSSKLTGSECISFFSILIPNAMYWCYFEIY